jgi:cbb3-type cytochrome oxidase maturation protein
VDILFLLIPMSVVLALAILGVFAWAVQAGQFDELDQEGTRILGADDRPLAPHQRDTARGSEESS